MKNIIFSTRNMDDFISEVADEVVKKIELWYIKPQQSSNPHERLTRRQVSQQYKVSLGTIHNLMKAGKLAYEKVGRKTLFRREDLEICFTNKKG